MLKRLRIKFICITMVIVTLMLCVIFGLLIHFTARDLEKQSLQLLQTVAEAPMKPARPGSAQVLLPYFVLRQSPVGDMVVSAGEHYFDLYDEAFLQQVLTQAEATGAQTGVLRSYGLRFLRREDKLGKTFAFVDITGHIRTVGNLALTCLAVGCGCFAVLLGISMLLARWAVKPVEKAWEEQRQFVADASHELKTPLTVITTNAELLASSAGEEPNRGQFVENIQTMTRQMRGLVEGLLELARVDNGAARAEFSRVALSEAVASTVLPFEALLFEAGLELEEQIEPSLAVLGSQRHLCQVVEILLDNAAKYTTPQTKVWVWLRRTSAKECTLSVAGHGQPLSPTQLRDIFKRFYRVEKARSMNGSYGLGLAIAKTVVEDHGGKIWAQSADGINSFFVNLPLIP